MANELTDMAGNKIMLCPKNCKCPDCHKPLYLIIAEDKINQDNGLHKCINPECEKSDVTFFPPIFH